MLLDLDDMFLMVASFILKTDDISHDAVITSHVPVKAGLKAQWILVFEVIPKGFEKLAVVRRWLTFVLKRYHVLNFSTKSCQWLDKFQQFSPLKHGLAAWACSPQKFSGASWRYAEFVLLVASALAWALSPIRHVHSSLSHTRWKGQIPNKKHNKNIKNP